jgi:hypothetical protein
VIYKRAKKSGMDGGHMPQREEETEEKLLFG